MARRIIIHYDPPADPDPDPEPVPETPTEPEADRPTCWLCLRELCDELDAYYGLDADQYGLCTDCRLGRRKPVLPTA